jgi:hypothetical protein
METKPSLFLHYCRLLFPSPSTYYPLLFHPSQITSLSSVFFSFPLPSPFLFLPSSYPSSFLLTPSPLLFLQGPDPHYCSLRVPKGYGGAAQCRHCPLQRYSSVGSWPARISSVHRIQFHTSRLTISSISLFQYRLDWRKLIFYRSVFLPWMGIPFSLPAFANLIISGCVRRRI